MLAKDWKGQRVPHGTVAVSQRTISLPLVTLYVVQSVNYMLDLQTQDASLYG